MAVNVDTPISFHWLVLLHMVNAACNSCKAHFTAFALALATLGFVSWLNRGMHSRSGAGNVNEGVMLENGFLV